MRYAIVFFLLFISTRLIAQSVEGRVLDTLNKELRGAVISLIDSSTHQTVSYAIAQTEGRFSLPLTGGIEKKLLIIMVRHVGYWEYRKLIDVSTKDFMNIRLIPSSKILKEIVIQVDHSIELRGDTTVYNAQKYLTAEDKKLKDLFIKMPGFVVDEKGRLTYKGNTVEKLFIDGDDPAGNNYGLLTKNASVDFVNKVEVIEHFDDNRLMRNVRRTDKVAVNLITKEEYRMRVSGTVDLGLTTGKKRNLEFTTTYLGKPLKQLNFFSANNAGRSLDGNFSGELYESIDEKMEDLHDHDNSMEMIDLNQLRMPQLDERITLHNNDQGVASVMSLKVGKYTKANAQFGFSKTRQWIQKNETSYVTLGANNFWKTNSAEKQQIEELGLFSTLSFKRDKGGNHTSSGFLMIKKGEKNNSYSNLMTGNVQDSLFEGLNDKSWLYNANWNHTIRVGKNVMGILFKSQRNSGWQDYSIQTLRMLKYFKLDSSYKYYLQNSSKILGDHSVEVKLNGKKGKQKFELGWNNTYATMEAGYNQYSYKYISGNQFFLRASDFSTSLFSSVIYGKSDFNLTRKISMDVKSKLGVSRLTNINYKTTIPEFNNHVTFSRSIGKHSIAFVGGEWERAFTDWSKFMPSYLLTGNASFGNGLTYMGPSEKFDISGGVQSVNIFKNSSFLLSANYSRSRFSYGSSSIRFPEYSILGYQRYKNNNSSSLIMSKKLFIRALKSSLVVSMNWMDHLGILQLNGMLANQRMTNAGLGVQVNTGFDGPLNINLEGKVAYFKNQWNDLPVTSNTQYSLNSKIRCQINKKLYMASRWKYFQFAPKKGFNAMDYYVIWSINKIFDAQLEAINLLNKSTFDERNVDALSENTSSFILNKRFLLFTLSMGF